jgi:hypothetical protein
MCELIKIGLPALTVACVAGSSGADSTKAASKWDTSTQTVIQTDVRCYRSSESVLLGPSTERGQRGHPPGWVRLEGLTQSSSGDALLLDAGGFGLGAGWRRSDKDSVRVVGFDDFLRTELSLVITEDSAVGRASAHSDATLEPDASGKVGDLRRAWSFSARRAPCDSMPRRAGRQ